MTNWRDHVMEEMRGEAEVAEQKYGSLASSHEGFGVLAEEVLELLVAIQQDDAIRIHVEAVQVAAVSVRLAAAAAEAHESGGEKTPFAQHSFKWARP
jgi:hypothetical protein